MPDEDTHTLETAGGLTITHPASNRRFGFDISEHFDARDPIDTMPHGSFQSSNVHSGIYDFGERELGLRFLRDGTDAIYIYTGVPAQVWSGLVEASSKGSFVNRNIAFNYPYSKAGRENLPTRSEMESDMLRRFFYDP